jgi:hypothetical protein
VRLGDLAHAAGANPLDDAIAADAATDQFVGRAIDQDRGRCFEKLVGAIVREEECLDVLPQEVICATGVREMRGTCLASRTAAASKIALTRVQAGGVTVICRTAAGNPGFRPRQSRLTVAGETPRTAAVSSIVSPPKKRSSTMRACCGSIAPRRSSALVERGDIDGFRCRDGLVAERGEHDAATALVARAVACMVDQDTAHQRRRHREEMRARPRHSIRSRSTRRR